MNARIRPHLNLLLVCIIMAERRLQALQSVLVYWYTNWYSASPLPEPQYKMSSTLIGNMWYLLGGYPSLASRPSVFVSVLMISSIKQFFNQHLPRHCGNIYLILYLQSALLSASMELYWLLEVSIAHSLASTSLALRVG